MKISQSKIDEISAASDIVDIISRYTHLRKAGRNFMGRCPFHDERTPSFSVSQEKGVYHCFGCGKSGNVFNFIMEKDNVTFYEALKILAERANIKIEFEEGDVEDRNQLQVLYEIHRKAARFFYENLSLAFCLIMDVATGCKIIDLKYSQFQVISLIHRINIGTFSCLTF